MDGFACGAMGPPVSLESYRLSSFKETVIAEASTVSNSHWILYRATSHPIPPEMFGEYFDSSINTKNYRPNKINLTNKRTGIFPSPFVYFFIKNRNLSV